MLRLALRAAVAVSVVSLALVAAAPLPAAGPSARYTMTPLVSNQPGVAPTTDSNLQNAWGLARSATSPWWVSDNGANVTTVYNSAGALQSIGGNPFQTVPGGPSGAVFSGIAGQFQVGTTASPTTLGTSNFIFSAEDGQIRAWRGGSTGALVTVPNSVTNGPNGDAAVFKGLAISNGTAGPRLYATDFHNARVAVFDGGWNMVNDPGAFEDASIPDHYAPFGIQTIGSRVFVTYAKQDAAAHDDAAGVSRGFVDVYDLAGSLLARVAQRGSLNSPWGLALAPAGFGRFGGDLLVGNFGDGLINAFEEMPNGEWNHRGSFQTSDGGQKLQIDGLWALQFGNAGSNGNANTLFFTAGPNGEADGLFGSLAPSTTK